MPTLAPTTPPTPATRCSPGFAHAFPGACSRGPTETAPFLTDWRKRYVGRALAVAQPDSAEDVAAVVRWCAEHRIPVVPQGGNTGLVGGGTPDATGHAIVLSLARLNKVRAVDTINNTITVEAGCILQNLQQAARQAQRLFPLSLAAEGVLHDRRQPVDQCRRRSGAALRQYARAVPGTRSRHADRARCGTGCAACARTTPATT